jgi:hypothetical protein
MNGKSIAIRMDKRLKTNTTKEDNDDRGATSF